MTELKILEVYEDFNTHDRVVYVQGQKRPIRINERLFRGGIDDIEQLVIIEIDRRKSERLFSDSRHDRGWPK